MGQISTDSQLQGYSSKTDLLQDKIEEVHTAGQRCTLLISVDKAKQSPLFALQKHDIFTKLEGL